MQKKYKRRYQECLSWIKDSFLLRREIGLLNSIFWSLPIIFIEGKVVCAFYMSEDPSTPCLDTINTPGKTKLFKFESFEKALEKVNILTPVERINNDGKFDFLDYFGIPCHTKGKELYLCHFNKFDLFGGEIRIWVVEPYDRDRTKLLDWKSHTTKLGELFLDINKLYQDELYKDESGDKDEKKRFFLFGHKFDHDTIESSPKIELSPYLCSAFDNLHNALLASLEWKEYPCRVFILINNRLFSAGLRFILTEKQKQFYKDKYKLLNELLKKCSLNKQSGYMRMMIKEKHVFDKTISAYKKKKGKTYREKWQKYSNPDIGSFILEHEVHTGVSSFSKQRGLPELFLEKEKLFTQHPIIHKLKLIERRLKKAGDFYDYPSELSKIEPFFLIQLPNFSEAKVGSDKFNYEYEFAMIPIFFRDHSIGCIAFFNPEAKKKEDWYHYLYKVYRILDEKEKTVYQAAINDLCQQTLKVFETSAKNINFVIKSINKKMTEGLFSGHFFIGHSKNNLLERIKKYYISSEANFNKMAFEGKPQDDVIKEKTVRGYTILDRVNAKEPKESGYYFACIDSKDHYSPWEIQTDIDVKENIEAGLLTYSRKLEILRHGSRAAVTAIMSRNISHNIGSHVINYWNSHIESKLPPERSRWGERDELPNLLYQSRNLLGYLQQRMDFLANISTSMPSSECSLDFKTEICEPIFGKDDSTVGYKNLEALLSNITKSEGIKIDDRSFNVHICTDNNNQRVMIPNGLTGRQGIYSILENFIRNTAKHYKGADKNYSVWIVLKEAEDSKLTNDYYELNIWDMRNDSCNKNVYNAFKEFLPGGSKSKYIDDNAEINPDGWGFKEMYASANFLRKQSPHVLQDTTTIWPPLVDILCNAECNGPTEKCKHDNNHRGKLGLRLFLRKPKDMLVLSDAHITSDIFGIDNLDKMGLRIDGLKDYEVPHRILLAKVESTAKYDQPNFPCRIIKSDISTISDRDYLCLYRQFIRRELSGGSKTLYYKAKERVDNFAVKVDHDITTLSCELPYDSSTILLYYHLKEQFGKLGKAAIDSLFNSVFYLQPVSGGYSTYTKLVMRPQNISIQEHFFLELLESAVTSVMIIDERISEWQKRPFSNTSDGHSIYVADIINKMNIFAVDIDLDDLSNIEANIEATLGKLEGKPKHFVVIHQGILDKLTNRNILKTKGIADFRWMVVDSGRGVPHGLNKEARFSEISSLLQLLYNYDKHGLVQTLFASRRPRNSDTEDSN